MVVTLHLYKLLKHFRKFTELMTKNFETTITGVDCLIPFNDQLKVHKIITFKLFYEENIALDDQFPNILMSIIHMRLKFDFLSHVYIDHLYLKVCQQRNFPVFLIGM